MHLRPKLVTVITFFFSAFIGFWNLASCSISLQTSPATYSFLSSCLHQLFCTANIVVCQKKLGTSFSCSELCFHHIVFILNVKTYNHVVVTYFVNYSETESLKILSRSRFHYAPSEQITSGNNLPSPEGIWRLCTIKIIHTCLDFLYMLMILLLTICAF